MEPETGAAGLSAAELVASVARTPVTTDSPAQHRRKPSRARTGMCSCSAGAGTTRTCVQGFVRLTCTRRQEERDAAANGGELQNKTDPSSRGEQRGSGWRSRGHAVPAEHHGRHRPPDSLHSAGTPRLAGSAAQRELHGAGTDGIQFKLQVFTR